MILVVCYVNCSAHIIHSKIPCLTWIPCFIWRWVRLIVEYSCLKEKLSSLVVCCPAFNIFLSLLFSVLSAGVFWWLSDGAKAEIHLVFVKIHGIDWMELGNAVLLMLMVELSLAQKANVREELDQWSQSYFFALSHCPHALSLSLPLSLSQKDSEILRWIFCFMHTDMQTSALTTHTPLLPCSQPQQLSDFLCLLLFWIIMLDSSCARLHKRVLLSQGYTTVITKECWSFQMQSIPFTS